MPEEPRSPPAPWSAADASSDAAKRLDRQLTLTLTLTLALTQTQILDLALTLALTRQLGPAQSARGETAGQPAGQRTRVCGVGKRARPLDLRRLRCHPDAQEARDRGAGHGGLAARSLQP